MEKRDFEGTAMHIEKDIKLKGILTGRWGQFMDSRRTGVHLGLALALLVFPALSAWASSDVTAASYSSNAAGDVVITLSTAGDEPKVDLDDPLAGHKALLPRYEDSDIHDVTAYLVTIE